MRKRLALIGSLLVDRSNSEQRVARQMEGDLTATDARSADAHVQSASGDRLPPAGALAVQGPSGGNDEARHHRHAPLSRLPDVGEAGMMTPAGWLVKLVSPCERSPALTTPSLVAHGGCHGVELDVADIRDHDLEHAFDHHAVVDSASRSAPTSRCASCASCAADACAPHATAMVRGFASLHEYEE
jgi:hypothetical protein